MQFRITKSSSTQFTIEADDAEKALAAVKNGQGTSVVFNESYQVGGSQQSIPAMQRPPVKPAPRTVAPAAPAPSAGN